MNALKHANQQALAIAIDAVDTFPWHKPLSYANWLAQTYHYTAHTVSLLSLMVARTNIKNEHSLHQARINHSAEEVGHDQWVRQDLKSLGFGLDDFPELPQTRCLWEPQFFKCDHISVEAVYGYTIILEQLAVQRGALIAESTKQLAGGQCCNRFLSGHSSADIPHVKKDLKIIDSFAKIHQQAIIDNMFQTAEAYASILRAVA